MHRLRSLIARVPGLDNLARDSRVALRGFNRSRTFAVTAVLILALAIGMAAAMTTVINAVLIQRLPVRAQDQLVELWPFRDRGSELLLFVVALAAAYVPARRATRIDPIRTLRAE